MGDQRHPNHLFGNPLGFIGRTDDFDATALTPAAGMNLRLDDRDVAAQPSRDVAGFRRRKRDFTPRNGHAETRQDLLGLVLVDFHKRVIVSK